MTGFNKADIFEKFAWDLSSADVKNRPCVFFSHKKEDKSQCREIAKYFQKAGIDFYLDERDNTLQNATANNAPFLITESIKKGIRESTHMLVVVSGLTYKSQWVPFEVGYGHAAILDQSSSEISRYDRIKLSILTLKDISESILPDFMKIGNIIRGTKSINEYIAAISNRLEKAMLNESRISSNSKPNHPLDDVLNWQL